jgi:branched-chain amino acid transport system ATP-binding protein
MAIVRRLCRRVSVMVEGRIAAEGTLAEVATRGDVLAAYLGRGWT